LNLAAEQPAAVDGPLRGPPLNRSVDMTADVKGWAPLFYVCILNFPFCLSEEAEPVRHDG
jgi:hypothetical protein